MKSEVFLRQAGCADGIYNIYAPNFVSASLYWSDGRKIIEDWTAFAYVSLDMQGKGVFTQTGGQMIPCGATHIAALLIDAEGKEQTIHMPVLTVEERKQPVNEVCFTMMSDLHLSSKGGRVRRALQLGKNSDCVLLAGDLTNDGTGEQLREFARYITAELDGVPVLAVTGNHDYPRWPIPLIPCEEIEDYPSFQRWLIDRARRLGVQIETTSCGAYRAWIKGVPVIGLNAASHFRTFTFKQGNQLDHLERWISEGDMHRHIVICHAPLLTYNPVRRKGVHSAYLSQDKELQGILDRSGNCIFLSGHTHISVNDEAGCVQKDERCGNFYINDSSVTRTMMVAGAASPDAQWLDGAVLHLKMNGKCMSLTGQCISSQKYISRAYYIF